MFTLNTIALAKFGGKFGMSVLRDCAMSYVGKIPTRLEKRLVSCGTAKHVAAALQNIGIVGIITKPEFAALVPETFGLAVSENPQASAYLLHEHLCGLPDFLWKDFDTRIDPTAIVCTGAMVAERNVVIGAGTIIMAGAVICERAIIGTNCVISPGAVVGCDAFEIDLSRSPRVILKQAGGVLLGDNVEIQANSTIVRSTFGGFTTIGAETKIDCQVYVAHDCDVGKRVQIAGNTSLLGRVSVGDDTFIGPNCSISNGVKIGKHATVSIGSVVVRDVEAGARVTGNFAVPHANWLRFVKSLV
jgi:UDP-3-O-[3-hydroxymyristoyl] glucosamine N-acyltransferase LpxD